jgi:hypothetical protein
MRTRSFPTHAEIIRLTIRLRMTVIVLLLSLGTAFSASQPPLPYNQSVATEATVRLVFMPCWVLDTKYGRLEPTNLDGKFKIDGLKVFVTVRPRDDVATTCAVGDEIVTVLNIARVDAAT